MTATLARTTTSTSSHWYYPDGRACYEVPYADPSKGMRPTTLKDARKLGLLPSVTTILKCLNKPALNDWMCEQAALAVLTAPRLEGEELDAFVKRVLQDERQQDDESAKARDLGTDIHDALECALNGQPWPESFSPYVNASMVFLQGRVVATEKVLVGNGYAGKTDLVLEDANVIRLVDFKSTKNLPTKESWTDHRLQTSAYAKALGNTGDKHVATANLYVSTTEPGKVAYFEQDDWQDTYAAGFRPVLQYWQWLNNYFAL